MTKAQAGALHAKWKQQVDPPTCEHLNRELETNEMGYLTGNPRNISTSPSTVNGATLS